MSGSTSARIGGRPATIDVDDIVAAGRSLGLQNLSLSAVATRLGVTPAALYRHVDGRWGLEQLIGESLLADLELVDDPESGIEAHLVEFGTQLRDFTLAHPGLADYLHVAFPRGASGAALLVAEVAALERRGYDTLAALILANAVAGIAIGLAAGEAHRIADAEGQARQAQIAEQIVAEHPGLGAAFAQMPRMSSDTAARFLLTASVAGLVAVAPPGRPVAQTFAELEQRGGIDPTELN